MFPKEFIKYENQEALDNQDFEREEGMYYKHNNKKINKKSKIDKKNKEKKKNEEKYSIEKFNINIDKIEENSDEIFFLKKKTISNHIDLTKIYNDLMKYINDKSKFKNDSIINLLGPIKSC